MWIADDGRQFDAGRSAAHGRTDGRGGAFRGSQSRVIAQEKLVITLLAQASTVQLELARGMAAPVSPRLDMLDDAFRLFRCRSILNCVGVCPKNRLPAAAIGKIKEVMVRRAT